ncbi:hypothetical protein EDC39_11478 [Geothermobacter ehrlichii]|uniref:Carboxypeptidase family protein n=1 Tax=Geothermobacter ehrlichii TaxID=213224 RepID=A0A5D3WHP0_9BACT|nr:hypothetical protein [Geothermobacter ehrlichii]TYO96372.1 hypothetical protein EDC39_11478 [Geothermobacter ehrlichii]
MTPIRFWLSLVLLPLLAACVGLGGPRRPNLAGRTMLDGQPVAGIRVFAYPRAATTLAGAAPYVSVPSDADGRFGLQLPPGRYFLLARGKNLFTYYGRNPVTIGETPVTDLNLGLVRSEQRAADLPQPFVDHGVQVQLLADGRPLPDATLYVYLDLTSDLKGMGYVMAGPSDAEGLVEASLPAGTYYLLARKRANGQQVGPLGAGDWIGYWPGNPLRLGEGKVRRLVIPMFRVPEKSVRQMKLTAGCTLLAGTIRDASGKPVAGVRAVLYSDAQMLNRPDLVSEPTGADGRWQLLLPAGGTYYLGARNTLGGAPGPGDLYGTYNGSDDHSVRLKTGETLRGLQIVVEEMW